MELIDSFSGEVISILAAGLIIILFIALMDGRKERDPPGRGFWRKKPPRDM